MKTTEDLIGTRKGESALIVGAGATIRDNEEAIDKFINKTKPFIIGINNMTNYFTPTYHLWTNNSRFRNYGKGIAKSSTVLLGSNISLKVINSVIGNRDYILITRNEIEGTPVDYRNGVIYGYYRTAGNVAVFLAHLMGASEINIVGFDGYTMHDKNTIISGNESQHCYGTGLTDTSSWESGFKKDVLINKALYDLRSYGVDFNILTPTKYADFYKGGILQ